jgi:hypothetical protein
MSGAAESARLPMIGNPCEGDRYVAGASRVGILDEGNRRGEK